MTSLAPTRARSDPRLAIGFIMLAMVTVSANDMLIKHLSDRYPLHELIFVRSAVALAFSLMLVQVEGGWGILRTEAPLLHLLRCLLIVAANMVYFAALAVLPLADATALFYVMPLFITLLSIPLLGERAGPWRMAAVVAGFVGVVLMVGPGRGAPGVPWATQLLPILAALLYALMQILTRRLGVRSKASAMAVYIQCTFIAVGLMFYLVAGDGRFAEGSDDPSVRFLLRAWRWPGPEDQALFALLGALSGVVGYSLSQAYRSAEAATVAPFEYTALPLAIFWGWAVWGHLPGPGVSLGIVLIAGAGLVVFLRERRGPARPGRPPGP